jgi:Predicted hydrolases or acyltransferases (alpha/beta hydrolase superfamily)
MKISWLAMVLSLSLAATTPVAAETDQGFVAGADHVRIHYLQSGPADARHTLLLIPGWRISAAIWSKQLGYFSRHQYRVIAMDSRSQGSSSVVQTGNAPENRAGDIQQVISGLHLTHVILIGWSQGAQDVAAYVNRFGTSAVDGLALIDSPVSAGPDDVTGNPGFIKIILGGIASYAKDSRGYSDGMMHAIISTPTARETYAQLDDESLKTPTDIGISMLVQDLFTTDRRPTLKKFDKPTLVVASGKSPLLDAQRHMAAVLPEGQFIAIDHASHAVFFDQPDEFDHRLAAFVASIIAGTGAPAP